MRNHADTSLARKPEWLKWIGACLAALAILLGSLGFNTLRLSQASAAELTENIITDASVTKKELNPQDYTTQLDMGFKLPNGIHSGDTSTITLPDDFTFNANLDFDVKSSDGHTVAKAHLDAATGKMTLTYTDYVESHSDITGKISAAIRIKTDKVKTYGKKAINLDVNGKFVPAGEINYGPWNGDNPNETIAKWSNTDYNTGTIKYFIRVSARGEDMKKVTVSDTLRSAGMSYDKSSFKITRGKWVMDLGIKSFVLQNGTDVTASTAINYTNEGYGGFSINLGDLGTDGYMIEYKVKLNHAPLNGEQFKNRVLLNYNGKTEEFNSTVTWQSASGEANGYNYSIKLRKTDVNGRTLKGAIFSVVRDSSGETVGTITTGEDGTGSLGGLLRDNYTITETTAPDGYEKADPVKITAEQLKNDAKTAEITVVDKLEEKTSVKVTKAWDDSDNTDGVRPDSVQVQLRADGKKSGDLVTLNEANHWTYTWTGLKAKNNGQDIKYTVSEVLPANGKYTFKVTGDAVSGFIITNSHRVERTSVSVSKVWDDRNDQDGVRPSSVSVQLYADGKASGDPVTLDAANSWKYTWSGLDKNASGKAITYTVKETSVPHGYTSTISGDMASGFTVTNTHTPVVPPTPPVTPPTVPPAPKKPHLARTGTGLWAITIAGTALLLSGAAFILRRKDRGQRNTAANR